MIKPLLLIFFLTILIFATDMELQKQGLTKKHLQTKALPKQVDKYITLVNIKTDDSTITYIYEIDTTLQADKDLTTMRKEIIKGTCVKSRHFLDADISLEYLYKNARTKSELFKFYVNQESCYTL